MTNPRLRILLVDEEHSKRMNIEKNFAWLGYCRIAPLASMGELLVVLDNAIGSFDLLVINESVLTSSGAVLEHVVRVCPDIKNLLIYQAADLQGASVSNFSVSPMSFLLPYLPDTESIRGVMSFVDDGEVQNNYNKKQLSIEL